MTFWVALFVTMIIAPLVQVPSAYPATDFFDCKCGKSGRDKIEDCSGKSRNSTSSSGRLQGLPDHWANHINYPACYRAEIIFIEKGFYIEEGRHSGEAKIGLKVLETLWGPKIDSLSVWVNGIDIPGCISYDRNGRFEQLEYISPGAEILLQCSFKDCCWETNKFHFFLVGGTSPVSIQESDMVKIRTRASQENNILDRAGDSSLICKGDYVRPEGAHRHIIKITSVIKGNSELCNKDILIHWPGFSGAMKKQSKRVSGFVLFLQEIKGIEKENGTNWMTKLADEGVIDASSILLPRFGPVKRGGSVLWPQENGFHNSYGFPTELPELLEAVFRPLHNK